MAYIVYAFFYFVFSERNVYFFVQKYHWAIRV